MSELRITIQVNEEGDRITLPFAQMVGIADCIKTIQADGKDAMWHPAACGCCYLVHAIPPEGEIEHEGFVVGPDGGASWIEHQHGEGNQQ
jgi:hypothetical protein